MIAWLLQPWVRAKLSLTEWPVLLNVSLKELKLTWTWKKMYNFSGQFSMTSLREGIEGKTADEKNLAIWRKLGKLIVGSKISVVTSAASVAQEWEQRPVLLPLGGCNNVLAKSCWHRPVSGVCSVLLCRAWSCRKGSKQGSTGEGRALTVLLWPAWCSWPRSFWAWAWGSWSALLAALSPWFRHPPWRWSAAASWLSAFVTWTRTARSNWKKSPHGSVFFFSGSAALVLSLCWRCWHVVLSYLLGSVAIPELYEMETW